MSDRSFLEESVWPGSRQVTGGLAARSQAPEDESKQRRELQTQEMGAHWGESHRVWETRSQNLIRRNAEEPGGGKGDRAAPYLVSSHGLRYAD